MVTLHRQNAAGGSSEEFDSESSILVTKRPNSRARRSRSSSRLKESDSSTSAGTKKTTFFTGESQRDSSDRQNGSIKSSSSYDVSKISFQGKRALFEAGNPTPAQTVGHLTKSAENIPTIVQESNMMNLEQRNRQLEQEIAGLQQTAAVREEMGKRLRETVERLELELKERERFQHQDITLLQKDNRDKESLIQLRIQDR